MHRQIRPGDRAEATRLDLVLEELGESGSFPGLAVEVTREVLVLHFIESMRRNRYVDRIRDTPHSKRVLGFDRDIFDPLMGAMVRWREGDIDDACWLVFLSVHFGRHRRGRWALTCNFYNRLGGGGLWDWHSVRADVAATRRWLDANQIALKAEDAGFGNHRKYESLDGTGLNGTGETIESYVHWVGESHTSRLPIDNSDNGTGDFASLFGSMSAVHRFGRTAKFDYLTMLGKLGIADLRPDRAYLNGATGPLSGARLLISGSRNAHTAPADLERALSQLQLAIDYPFDVIEDALCNWQKSPRRFIAFRG